MIVRRGCDPVVPAQNPRRCASTRHHAKGQIHSPWTACRARSRVGITTSVAPTARRRYSQTTGMCGGITCRVSSAIRKQVSERCVVPLIRTPTWAYRLYGNPVLRAVFGWDWRRRDIRWLRPTQGRVVEIGSGSGFYTRYLAQRLAPGGTVVAVDPCPTAVAAVCARLGPRVVGVAANGQAIPIASDSVDAVFYGYCLEEFDDPHAGVREAARVLARWSARTFSLAPRPT